MKFPQIKPSKSSGELSRKDQTYSAHVAKKTGFPEGYVKERLNEGFVYDEDHNRLYRPVNVIDKAEADEYIRMSNALRDELAALLNRHKREIDSDTPDYILAEYLMSCLVAFERATITRGVWRRDASE